MNLFLHLSFVSCLCCLISQYIAFRRLKEANQLFMSIPSRLMQLGFPPVPPSPSTLLLGECLQYTCPPITYTQVSPHLRYSIDCQKHSSAQLLLSASTDRPLFAASPRVSITPHSVYLLVETIVTCRERRRNHCLIGAFHAFFQQHSQKAPLD